MASAVGLGCQPIQVSLRFTVSSAPHFCSRVAVINRLSTAGRNAANVNGSDGDTQLQRPSDRVDRPIIRMGLMPNSRYFAVSNLHRGWFVALVWKLGTRAESKIKMLAPLGTVFYRCNLAIAFACSIAATIILMAIIQGKPSGSEAWMAAVFFVAVGISCWLVSRAVDSRL